MLRPAEIEYTLLSLKVLAARKVYFSHSHLLKKHVLVGWLSRSTVSFKCNCVLSVYNHFHKPAHTVNLPSV